MASLIVIAVVVVVMVIRTDKTTRTHGTNKTDRTTMTHGTHKSGRITWTRDRQDRQVRDERQDRRIWHLNLTFQVTCVGQLSQFLRCLRPHTNTCLATKSEVCSLQYSCTDYRDKMKEGVFLLSGGCICMSSSQIRGVVNAYPLYPGQKKTYITTTNS